MRTAGLLRADLYRSSFHFCVWSVWHRSLSQGSLSQGSLSQGPPNFGCISTAYTMPRMLVARRHEHHQTPVLACVLLSSHPRSSTPSSSILPQAPSPHPRTPSHHLDLLDLNHLPAPIQPQILHHLLPLCLLPLVARRCLQSSSATPSPSHLLPVLVVLLSLRVAMFDGGCTDRRTHTQGAC